jgi:hypothetical protein
VDADLIGRAQHGLGDQGDVGDEVWISFAPVLPHGEVTWLGPG